jgi:Flp pilus assembly pilin Flp
MAYLHSLIIDRNGATAIEYGLIVGLIAICTLGTMGLAGNALGNTLTIASNQMTNAPALAGKS